MHTFPSSNCKSGVERDDIDEEDDHMGLATPAPLEYLITSDKKDFSNPMSQDYRFSFSNGFEKQHQQQQQKQNQHIAQQIRRDKLRVQGFEPASPLLVGIEEENNSFPVYETTGMLSEMFNFPSGGAATATELLETQILNSYRNPPSSSAVDWFSHRQDMMGRGGGGLEYAKNQISSINGDSAAAMQLFLKQSSPSPTSSIPNSTSSTLHMLLPNPSSSSSPTNLQNFHNAFGQFAWNENNPNEIGGVVEGQGLSLSLSSSLQHFGGSSGGDGGLTQSHQLLGSSIGTMSMLRNSKYVKAAQELLEEFCSVGRGHQPKKTELGWKNDNNRHPNGGGGGGGGENSSSSSKDVPPLSASDRLEHQRRKVKLLSMLDEVNRRYTRYCDQMQMIVNSFNMLMGSGAAAPYTSLAQKAMSRHFRCLKDAVAAQLKHSCELLGEKDAATLGVTIGETPRLRILDQRLRQHRASHQIGMMEQEAWRPQRGLPERSVSILRAWLFEHFLHPYPSDADKHLLARQTGLSRNQVSNWFINARVRLWKPMIEEMYQQEIEAKNRTQNGDQTPPPPSTTTSAAAAFTPRSEIIAPENGSSFVAITAPGNRANNVRLPGPTAIAAAESFPAAVHDGNIGSGVVRFGTSAGDVSLTLGLRHAPEKSTFSVRDFDGC